MMEEEKKVRERLPTKMQLHLMVECKRLPELVEELANAVLKALGMDRDDEETREKAAVAIEQVLQKYVAAFQWCGFTVFCQEGAEYDPWKLLQAELVSWAGD